MPNIDNETDNSLPDRSSPENRPAAFTFQNVCQAKGKQIVLDSINLRIEDGTMIALIGPSGAGKTSLLRLMNRLDEPSGGQIYYRSLPISEYPVQNLRRQVGFVFQTPVMFPGTVVSNLRQALEIGGQTDIDADHEIRRVLALAELDPSLAGREGSQLSVGQKQRVNIARALMTSPEVLLMDEPTSALDPQTADKLMETVRQLAREKNLTVVMVTHRLSEARRVCDQTVVMEDGRIVAHGSTEEIFEHLDNDKIREFLSSGKDVK